MTSITDCSIPVNFISWTLSDPPPGFYISSRPASSFQHPSIYDFRFYPRFHSRNPDAPYPDLFDQTPIWKAPEIDLHDGRILDIPTGTLVADPTYPPEEKKFFRVP